MFATRCRPTYSQRLGCRYPSGYWQLAGYTRAGFATNTGRREAYTQWHPQQRKSWGPKVPAFTLLAHSFIGIAKPFLVSIRAFSETRCDFSRGSGSPWLLGQKKGRNWTVSFTFGHWRASKGQRLRTELKGRNFDPFYVEAGVVSWGLTFFSLFFSFYVFF
jgi:hypothetical protein